ncbi:cupin domain-containing protein [Pseudonocardia phyllosphaerae]|uniref:hypothetical protein n=1 Tax=Pseudonocardia phyllosphaerae TaxID=3390502 RepID=UPI00397BA68D
MRAARPVRSPLVAGALLVASAAVLAGCAQPGELGHELPAPDRDGSGSSAPADPGASQGGSGDEGGSGDAPAAPAPAPDGPRNGGGQDGGPQNGGAPGQNGAGRPSPTQGGQDGQSAEGLPGVPDPSAGQEPRDTPPKPPGFGDKASADTLAAVDGPVKMDSSGPAQLVVKTEVLHAGENTGWIKHPGSVITAVRQGTVTIRTIGRCEPQTYGPGRAFPVQNGQSYELRNDGPTPIVLTRSELLTPGQPERSPGESAC